MLVIVKLRKWTVYKQIDELAVGNLAGFHFRRIDDLWILRFLGKVIAKGVG